VLVSLCYLLIFSVKDPAIFATDLVELAFKDFDFSEDRRYFRASIFQKLLGFIILFQDDLFELLFTRGLALEKLQVTHPLLVLVQPLRGGGLLEDHFCVGRILLLSHEIGQNVLHQV
jgi:hypothetical protein